MSSRWPLLLFCALVVYLTLFYQLGNLAFLGADEPRYARIAQEMNLRGQYVTPTLNFRPWLEKPPLLFWLEAASFRLFGVQEWSARLPVALLAVWTLGITGVLAFQVAGGRAAVLSSLVLATSGLFFVFGRAASTDMPLVAALSCAMACAYRAGFSRRAVWGAPLGAALGLAVLAKGPVALVLFGAVFILYSLLTQSWGWNWRQCALALLTFMAVAVPWFWKIWSENGFDFVATFWLNHHLARFVTTIHHHWQPFWYYLAVLLVGFFPWVVFLGGSLVRLWENRRRLLEPLWRPHLFWWLWVLVPLVFFSSSQSKLPGYILPVFPPLAAIVGVEWERYLQRDLVSSQVMKRQVLALSLLGMVVAAALAWSFHRYYGSMLVAGFLVVPLVISIAWAGYEFKKRRPLPMFLGLVAGMTLLAALAFWQAAPIVEDYHSARDLCRLSLPWVSEQNPLILYRYFHHTALYYTHYRSTPEALPDVHALEAHLAAHPQLRYRVLTQQDGWNDLQSFFRARLIRHQGNLYLAEIKKKE